MISLIWKRKFCSKSRSMITVNLDFTDLKTFQSPESPVLPILPKKNRHATSSRVFSYSFKPNRWDYGWLQSSLEFKDKLQRCMHSKFTKKKCAAALENQTTFKARNTIMSLYFQKSLWIVYANRNLADFKVESCSKTVFVHIRPSNMRVNVLFWLRWFQWFAFWEKSWRDDFSEQW